MRWIAAMIACAAAAGWLFWTYMMPNAPPKRLAPDGTFFLLERVSKQADYGVYALAPGTEVHRISQDGALLNVTDGRETFELTSAQLTNDLDVAAAIAARESENQKHIKSNLEQEKRELSEKKKQMYIENARRMEQHEQRRKGAAAAGKPSSLSRGAYNQSQDVVGRVLYIDDHGYRYWVDPSGQRHYVP